MAHCAWKVAVTMDLQFHDVRVETKVDLAGAEESRIKGASPDKELQNLFVRGGGGGGSTLMAAAFYQGHSHSPLPVAPMRSSRFRGTHPFNFRFLWPSLTAQKFRAVSIFLPFLPVNRSDLSERFYIAAKFPFDFGYEISEN